MSRLRSLVTRLPYKKNKRDANTISGYNTIIDSFYFFLILLSSFSFDFLFATEKTSTRDIQRNFLGEGGEILYYFLLENEAR